MPRATVFAVLALAAVAALALPRPVRAQATRADSAAMLLDTAHRLDAQGSRAAASALLEEILRRFGDTPAAATVRGERAARPPEADRSGRLELVAWGTIYGAFLGLAVPAALGADNAGAYGAGLLIGPASGFYLASLYARRAQPTLGRARALTFGFRWGSEQGLLWYAALTSGASAQAVWGTMILGGAGGVTAAALYTRDRSVSPGLVTAVSHGSSWGTWFGLMAIGTFQITSSDAFKLVLAAGDAGLVAAILLTPPEISTGRVWATTAAGIAGAAAGLGIDLLIQSNDVGTNFAIPAVTSAVGLAFGARYGKRSEASGGHAALDPAPGRASALVEVGEGGTQVGFPALTPALVPAGERGPRRLYRPALAIPLFHATF